MSEQAVVFGEDPGLVGVLTEPDGPEPRKLAVLVLNAGILHRVGPNRLHVRVARALAPLGFPVLRFDYSGHGDSEARTDGSSYARATVFETQAAMDFLESAMGIEEFILMGICSGADNAFRTALEDPRVAGLAMIESFAFETRGYELDAFLRRLVSREGVEAALAAGAQVQPPGFAIETREEKASSVGLWVLPPAAEVRAGVEALVGRGTRICFACSTGGPSHYHYRRRLGDMVQRIPGGSRVRVRLIDDTDHTFTPLSRQELLTRELVDWARALTEEVGPTA